MVQGTGKHSSRKIVQDCQLGSAGGLQPTFGGRLATSRTRVRGTAVAAQRMLPGCLLPGVQGPSLTNQNSPKPPPSNPPPKSPLP